MLTPKNINVIDNPRIIFKIEDILKKVDKIHNTVTIGSRVVTIQNTPLSYANLMLLAMDQIKNDNPSKQIHFHIPYIEEQFKPVMKLMVEELLDQEKLIKDKMGFDGEFDESCRLYNSAVKFGLKMAETIAEKNYHDAIQLIVESTGNDVSISYSDMSEEGIINKIIHKHNIMYGMIGHLLQCEFVRAFTTINNNKINQVCNFNSDQQPLYIANNKNIDPIANGTCIPDGKYIATIVEVDIGADNLDATLNLNNSSIIEFDQYGNPILGKNMIERCGYFVNFASNRIPLLTNNNSTDINIWYDTFEPVHIVSIKGVEILAKTIAIYQMANNNKGTFNDPIDTIKFQTTIENRILDEIQSFAMENAPDVTIVRKPEIIDYDFNDTIISDMKLMMKPKLNKKLDCGNMLHIRAHNIDKVHCQYEKNVSLNYNINTNISHIANIANTYGIDLIKIDIQLEE